MTQLPPPNERPAIAAAVIVSAGRVLLVRRRVAENSLSWQFPAGEIEGDESPAEAAVRETREEVGLAVAAVKTLGERNHPATGRLMIYIACSVVGGTAHVADPEELAEVGWCDRAKLAEHVPYPLYDPVHAYVHALVE